MPQISLSVISFFFLPFYYSLHYITEHTTSGRFERVRLSFIALVPVHALPTDSNHSAVLEISGGWRFLKWRKHPIPFSLHFRSIWNGLFIHSNFAVVFGQTWHYKKYEAYFIISIIINFQLITWYFGRGLKARAVEHCPRAAVLNLCTALKSLAYIESHTLLISNYTDVQTQETRLGKASVWIIGSTFWRNFSWECSLKCVLSNTNGLTGLTIKVFVILLPNIYLCFASVPIPMILINYSQTPSCFYEFSVACNLPYVRNPTWPKSKHTLQPFVLTQGVQDATKLVKPTIIRSTLVVSLCSRFALRLGEAISCNEVYLTICKTVIRKCIYLEGCFRLCENRPCWADSRSQDKL